MCIHIFNIYIYKFIAELSDMIYFIFITLYDENTFFEINRKEKKT